VYGGRQQQNEKKLIKLEKNAMDELEVALDRPTPPHQMAWISLQ
jgi:hypothetical protein